MKITVKVGLLFAALWILIKMFFFWTGALGQNVVPMVLLNMLFVLLAISVALYLHKLKQTEYTNALGDIKNGMTAGVPYAMIVSIFIYAYYAKIDPEFNEHQKSEWEMRVKKELDAPGGLEKAQENNPDFEVLERDEIIAKMKSGYESFYNPTATMTLSMLALLLLATLNSIFVTVIMRRVVFRNMKYPNPGDEEPKVID
ncbi:MAG: hypothetical protein ACJAUD_000677 [Crocinitomicaceae bacterium]|jgi:hypothetical protein